MVLSELPLPQLCTHVFAFGHAAEAFRAVDEGYPGDLAILLGGYRYHTGEQPGHVVRHG